VTGRRSDRSLAGLLLAQRLVDGEAEALRAKEFWSVVDTVAEPERLLGLTSADIAGLGVAPDLSERIARRMEAAPALAFELERLEQSGLRVLSALDDDYPQRFLERLGRTAPPIMHVAGDAGLLGGDGVGVVGSRHADADALEVAASAAAEAARRSRPLVSGGARGVDQAAMAAALEGGGRAVAVLAEPLARRLREPAARRAITAGTLCLCTPYKPSAGFSVANAMGRNRLIYALTGVTLVVVADEGSGGTWEGALEALRGRITDVAVWQGPGAGPGNAALEAQGARPVMSMADLFSPQPVETPQAAQPPQLTFEV
jgi:predicted Rossmann fold nucleotide-binding protein DprA/Smf involved in DNA uptake